MADFFIKVPKKELTIHTPIGEIFFFCAYAKKNGPKGP